VSQTVISADPTAELARLREENAGLRERMEEAEDTLRALRNNEIDAIVVGESIYTLVGANATANRMRGEVLTQMEDAVVATDLEGRVIYMNPAAERQYGRAANAVLGLPAERLYTHMWLSDDDHAQSRAALAAGDAWRGKVKHRLPDGHELQLECTLSCMADGDGGRTGYLSVLRDVTARAQAEAALADSQQLLQFSMESARIGLWTMDVESGLATGSDLHAACFGYSRRVGNWSGERFLAHVHPDDREHVESVRRQAVERAGDFHFECRVVWPDHSIHWIEVHGNTLLRNGEPARMAGIVSDITRRRQADEALREADRQKDEFLATLAHELRNPLAPIRTAAHVLASKRLTPEVHDKSVAIISRQVSHMARLLDDLLDIARITRKRLTLQKDYIDLRSAAETGIEASRAAIEGKRHHLVVEMPPTPIRLEADPVRVAQIVSNLLNNAAKYSNAGATITVSVRRTDGHGELVVKDTGIGMSPEALKSVFTMFAQEETVLDRSEGGLGIGLALVRGLAELHNGSVSAISPGLGRGSTFVVRFPVSEKAAARVPPVAEAQASDESQPGLRILIADDNHDAADSMATLLRLLGHDVLVAGDGVAAFEMARDAYPQVMLLDIGMPGLNGYELAHKLRQEAWGRNVLLIAATGWGQDEDKARATAAGFNAHLTKPFNPDALNTLIREWGA
jgi:PAS domain S-box-containing protein